MKIHRSSPGVGFLDNRYVNVTGDTMTGALLFTDNAVDIGASGATRPRTIYVGTSIINPLLIGGTLTTSDLTLQTTSGVGATGADMHFLVGNNGATEAMTILNDGSVGIGTTAPAGKLDVVGTIRTMGQTAPTSGAGLEMDYTVADGGRLLSYDRTGVAYKAFTFQGSTAAFQIGSDASKVMFINASGNVGIGTTSPTNLLSLGGNSARIFWMERHTTANTAGNTLTIQSGGATAAATNKAGGNLILAPGLSTGTGTNSVLIQTSPVGTTGTADNALTTRITVDSTEINLNWGLKIRRTATAVSYTALVTDYYIGVTSTAAARTIDLPAAATAGAGKTYIIKDESGAAGTNNITIDGSGAETIDGSATVAINSNYESLTLICDGSNWFVI